MVASYGKPFSRKTAHNVMRCGKTMERDGEDIDNATASCFLCGFFVWHRLKLGVSPHPHELKRCQKQLISCYCGMLSVKAGGGASGFE